MIKQSIRRTSQFLVLTLTLYLAFTHQRYGIEKAAAIDAYCPFGAIENFLTFIFTGEFLKRIYWSNIVLAVLVILTTLAFGRVFCGFFCPLGALQEWTRSLGRKIGFKKNVELPAKIDKYARYIKYLVLILIMYLSYHFGDLVFRHYAPFNALAHLGAEFDEKPLGYSLLILTLAFALFSKNWWCRYFCPLGAFLALIRKISPFEIGRNIKTCISCGKCDRVCPANLPVSKKDQTTSVDCISCLSCVETCPKNSLSAKISKETFGARTFSILVSVLFLGMLFILTFTPFWQTKPKSNIVNEAGVIDASNIRGSNTLKHLIETTGIPFEVFQQELGLPDAVEKHIKLKTIGPEYGLKDSEGNILDTEDFRQVVREYIQPKVEPEIITIEDCPFGETDCEFPGKCNLYTDQNGNDVCDRSE